jgi:ferredoxin
MKVTVDKDACMGSGSCKQIAPAVFDQREGDGVVILLEMDPPLVQHEKVRLATKCCPALAISVDES